MISWKTSVNWLICLLSMASVSPTRTGAGRNAPTWSKAWDIVRRVDRDNVGLCLDTFQIAGSEWVDPTTESSLIEADSCTVESLKEDFSQSLAMLTKTVPKSKIFVLQIPDAFEMAPPLPKETNEEGLRPRGQWSHDFRPLPFDGGSLQVVDVTRAVLGTGFVGWISVKVFDSKSHKGIMNLVADLESSSSIANTL
jgi:sugar phosphate isomerase/epimerase